MLLFPIKTNMALSHTAVLNLLVLLSGLCFPVLSQGSRGDVSIQTTTLNTVGVTLRPTPVDQPPTPISPELLGIIITISSLVVVLVILSCVLMVIFIRLRRNHVGIRKGSLSIPSNIQDASRHFSIGRSRDSFTPESSITTNQVLTKTDPPSHRPILAQLSKTLVQSMQQNPDYARCIVNSEVTTNSNDDSDVSPCATPDNCTRQTQNLQLPNMHVLSKTGTLGPVYDTPMHSPHDTVPLEVSPANITVVQELGEGTFGCVYLAEVIGLTDKDLGLKSPQKPVLVAVKMLRENASTDIQLAFEKECKFMSRLNHENVIRLLAVCRQGQQFLLMEHMENGDLHSFLQRYKTISTGQVPDSPSSISQRVLLYMSLQIASAMKYLASKNYVHRDLATRNCLVGRNFTIKVSDFGMSRNLYDSCYYVLQGKAILPVRWMACECFIGKFSQKSDVWAFGVTMWEIYTLAAIVPYHELNDNILIEDVMRGAGRQLLRKPERCPQDVFHVMETCWRHKPAERGDFSELAIELNRLYNS